MEGFAFTINTLLCLTVIVCKLFALHNLDWVSYKQNKLHIWENIVNKSNDHQIHYHKHNCL